MTGMGARLRATLLASMMAAAGATATAQTTAPSPEAISLGRELVEVTTGNKDQTLAAMRGPMAGLVGQMGISDPAKANTLVNEAMLPVLSEHFDDLLRSQAASYAQILSVDDLRAVITFYHTPAGKDLVAAQPALASARLTSLTQWLQGFQPEIAAKVKQVAEAHGWVKQP